MSPAAKIHAILLPLVAASAASLAGAFWARGLELRLLLGELAVLFILFPAAFYGTIYYIRWKWWRRNRRGVCGYCGRNPKAEGPGGHREPIPSANPDICGPQTRRATGAARCLPTGSDVLSDAAYGGALHARCGR
ncbi:MAG TPA: hypothetical protein VGI81_25240 [Tepidisphaeraceae bacterium]